jgi:Ca-activated chloride channel homolog
MSLRDPLWLGLFLVLLPWLVARVVARKKGKGFLYPIHKSLGAASGTGLLHRWLPLLVQVMGFAFLIFALARPQTSSSQVRRVAEGVDIVVALDVSKSMTIEDVGIDGRNRLDMAKDTVKAFIKGRQDDRIGFVMFSGESVTLCPITLDYGFLIDCVEQAEVDLLKDGTAIGNALATSTNRLRNSTAKSRVIILITDGDNNMGAIAPLTAGELAAGYGIKVYSIAIGTEGNVRMPEEANVLGFRRRVYTQVSSSINPELLQKISTATGGKFFRAQDDGSLGQVFAEINKLERTKVETKDRVLWEEWFQVFLLIGFSLVALDFILRRTLFRILPEAP